MNIQQLHDRLNDLKIEKLLSQSGFDIHNDLYDMECESDPDSLMLREELTDVLYHLDIASSILKHLKKKVVGEYTLHKNNNDRYSCAAWEFTCGNRIEFYDYDDDLEKYRWYVSRIEHNGNDYYIVGFRNLSLDGLRIRIRK
ncbi:MAG: DUF5348 domain-containing protein [Clostridia bacterium]|nr:DUF5348 domain-containing protein [Clostridia bacterium]